MRGRGGRGGEGGREGGREGGEGREGGREGGRGQAHRLNVCIQKYHPLSLSFFRKQRGRLKLCSESLLFDPIDIEHPIIKVNDYY